jgi:hypothetical protein
MRSSHSRALLVPIRNVLALARQTIDGVWSGQIARLRFYDSQQWVQAFLAPGNNSNLTGTTNNPTLIKMLFLARDNGRVIMGFTANNVILSPEPDRVAGWGLVAITSRIELLRREHHRDWFVELQHAPHRPPRWYRAIHSWLKPMR